MPTKPKQSHEDLVSSGDSQNGSDFEITSDDEDADDSDYGDDDFSGSGDEGPFIQFTLYSALQVLEVLQSSCNHSPSLCLMLLSYLLLLQSPTIRLSQQLRYFFPRSFCHSFNEHGLLQWLLS